MLLSVIIPTYHEEAFLGRTLEAVYQRAVSCIPEVIIVDAGSSDRTAAIARQYPVTLVVDAALRGKKWQSLNRGAAAAQGEVYLFLDADTQVPDGYDRAIFQCLQQAAVVGGAFEFAFDEQGWAYGFITLINRGRYRMRQRYYGDQGIFVRQDTFIQAGGWPARDILEAAYLCKNLRTYGRLQLIPLCIKTSTRRFAAGGIVKVFLLDMGIWWMDTLGLNTEQFAKRYWQQNEQRQNEDERRSEPTS